MNLAQTSPAMEEAWGVIKELSADERERLLAEDREKTRRDKAAYYETGLVEGRAEGRTEGYTSIIPICSIKSFRRSKSAPFLYWNYSE